LESKFQLKSSYKFFKYIILSFFKKIIASMLIGLVRFYQLAISPLYPAACRYTPTCSQYMIEAIREHGVLKGAWMGFKRISRCHPWGGSGYDPVPKKEKKSE